MPRTEPAAEPKALPSIASQLTRSVLPGILFTLLTGGLVLDVLITERLDQALDDALLSRAEALMALTEEENGKVEIEDFHVAMPAYSQSENPDLFVLYDASGAPIVRSSPATDKLGLSAPSLAAHRTFNDIRLSDGRPGRLLSLAFIPALDLGDDTDQVGSLSIDTSNQVERKPVILQVIIDRQAHDSLIMTIHLGLLSIGLILTALIALQALFGIRRAVRPLQALSEQVKTLDEHRLSDRMNLPDSSHELDVLTSRINQLLEKLQAAFDRERCFSSDVAHELRTPLTELCTLAEVNQRFPDNVELRQHFNVDLQASTKRMKRIVENLLALSRSEGGLLSLGEPADLSVLVQQALAARGESAAIRSLKLKVALPPKPACVTGGDLWALIVNNLVGNAIHYADASAEVRIEVRNGSGVGPFLSVANGASDLSEQDLTQMFNRLWRKDASRTEGGHSGLGLALVRSCCEQLGLDVNAALDAAHTLTMTVGRQVEQPHCIYQSDTGYHAIAVGSQLPRLAASRR